MHDLENCNWLAKSYKSATLSIQNKQERMLRVVFTHWADHRVNDFPISGIARHFDHEHAKLFVYRRFRHFQLQRDPVGLTRHHHLPERVKQIKLAVNMTKNAFLFSTSNINYLIYKYYIFSCTSLMGLLHNVYSKALKVHLGEPWKNMSINCTDAT